MHNVDQGEIDKFSEVAARWWDKEGEFKPLHLINPLRLDYIKKMSDGVFGKAIIDVGCGGGLVAEELAKAGAIVTGIDMATASLEVAKMHCLKSQLEVNYQCITAEQMSELQPNAFDVVTCLEMLEHVPEPESVVQACARLVKPGGRVFFSTLNRNMKAYLMGILAAEYLLNWVPKGTHDIKKFIKPSELMAMCEHHHLVIEDIIGLHYHPLTGQFYLSDKNVDVNYILCCRSLG